MILLAALILGLVAGLSLARWRGEPYRVPELRWIWLIPAAFAPQVVVAFLPASRELLPAWLSAMILPASLLAFLAFVAINWRAAGMPLLMAGLLLNLAVIAANGGWMPISPETASELRHEGSSSTVPIGSRFGQKDILLRYEDTRLAVLSDRFLLPEWSPYQVAFSAGDVLVAAGVFWLLASPPRAA